MRRKKFLQLSAALAGMGGLAAACKPSRRVIPGEIVGASAAVGHLLRDRQFGAPVMTVECDVAIVGGGVSGLSAARWLRRLGVKSLKVLDLEKKVGGNAACGKNSVSAYPWGAHYIPVPNPGLPEYHHFLEEAGVIVGHDAGGLPIFNEYHLCFDPQERLYMAGHWQDGLVPAQGLTAASRAEVERFLQEMDRMRNARGVDGLEAFAIPVDRSSKDPQFTELDAITMKEWLHRNGYRSQEMEWYVNYCTRDDFGTSSDLISAWTGIHYFAGRKGAGANAKRDDVLTWPEGNGWLVTRLTEPIADCLMTNALVIRVVPGPDVVEVHYLDVPSMKVCSVRAKQVIMAVPQFVANRLLPANAERIRIVGEHMQYTPWAVANLTVERMEERRGQPLSWDNVLYDSQSLGYVEATHQQLGQLKEELVLTWYRPLTEDVPAEARRKAQQRTHAEWVQMIFDDLRSVHPDIEERTKRIDIMIWGHAMAQPRPGWIHGDVRRSLRDCADPRIHFAHTDLAGISIFEEGFYQGIRAADEVVRAGEAG